MKGQEKRGTPSVVEGNPTQRGGRDTGLSGGQKGRGLPSDSDGNGMSRSGREVPKRTDASRGLTDSEGSVPSTTEYGNVSSIG